MAHGPLDGVKVLEYCSTNLEIFDIVVEDMDRQSRGLKG